VREIICDQGSAQWLQARVGKLTASRMVEVMSMLKKGGEGADRRNYRIEIITERITERANEHYISRDMERGSELEPLARSAYEMAQQVLVETAGFVLHPTLDYLGASPDGLVGNDGGMEIKCPRDTTHVRWLTDGIVPMEHRPQMYTNMLCCEREWWDFCSFSPYFKPFIVRLPRDEGEIRKIEEESARFNEEVEAGIRFLDPWILPKVVPFVDPRSAFEQVYDLIGQEIIP
jgi:hypothetical protein